MRRTLTLLVAVAIFLGLGYWWHVHQTSVPATTTTSSTTTVPKKKVVTPTLATVTIAAVGDTELGNTPDLPSDPSSYFDPVKSALAAPIVFGNLEGTMTNATTSKCGSDSTDCFAFRVPTSYANVYRAAGFTVLNAANNHSHDFGDEGVLSTSQALRAAGIAQAGLPGEIGVVRDGSLKVAFVDFAPYSTTNNLLDDQTAVQLIHQAVSEANLVVVYMHAGAEGANADHVTRQSEEYVGEDRGNPYAFAHLAIDNGADVVIASGPHVLRGMEFYRGHLIDYSLGDFANYQDFALDGDLDLSGILHVTLNAHGDYVAGSFTSIVLRGAGQAFIDPSDLAAHFVNTLSRDDFGNDAGVIGPSGAITPSS
jgi:hypothetical protein